ncbi:hypothetical protein G6F31_021678 [Rhizopus arrhizus]|nr:hypothetical protein G6F31_021678 [Rhizopus arrhizus]
MQVVYSSDLPDIGASEQSIGTHGQHDDHQREADDLGVSGAQGHGDQRFDHTEQQSGDHHAPGAGDAAQNRNDKGFQAE